MTHSHALLRKNCSPSIALGCLQTQRDRITESMSRFSLAQLASDVASCPSTRCVRATTSGSSKPNKCKMPMVKLAHEADKQIMSHIFVGVCVCARFHLVIVCTSRRLIRSGECSQTKPSSFSNAEARVLENWPLPPAPIVS